VDPITDFSVFQEAVFSHLLLPKNQRQLRNSLAKGLKVCQPIEVLFLRFNHFSLFSLSQKPYGESCFLKWLPLDILMFVF
jgi:hypothetical protein